MRLTVLGKSPSWADAGGACSGYLVEDGSSSALLDCGNGVFSKLRRFRDYARVDGVVISHLHADHFLDLVPYAYALRYSPRLRRRLSGRPGAEEPLRPRLLVPPGGRDVFRQVAGGWGSEDLIEEAFAIEEYAEASTPQIGSLHLAFTVVPHPVETFAIGVSSAHGGGRLVYGADSGPAEGLVRFALDVDLLLIEATLTHPESEGPRGHLTAREAGEHGRSARARRVVLTHISDELDPFSARTEAAAAFGAPVQIAREGAVYEV